MREGLHERSWGGGTVGEVTSVDPDALAVELRRRSTSLPAAALEAAAAALAGLEPDLERLRALPLPFVDGPEPMDALRWLDPERWR